jgi:hypothetical protein
MQVLRVKISMIEPILMTVGGFDYNAGEGVDEDEAADSRALLPRTLAALPGGGVVAGTILEVVDESQALNFEIVIAHQVMGVAWVCGVGGGGRQQKYERGRRSGVEGGGEGGGSKQPGANASVFGNDQHC